MLEDAVRIVKLHRLFGSALEPWYLQSWLMEQDFWVWEDVTRTLCYLRDRLGAPLESRSVDHDGDVEWRYRPAENFDYKLPGMWQDVWLLHWDKVAAAERGETAPVGFKAVANPGVDADHSWRLSPEGLGLTIDSTDLHYELGQDRPFLRNLRYLRTAQHPCSEEDKQTYLILGEALFQRWPLQFEDPAGGGPRGQRRRVVAVQALSVRHGRWTLDVQALDGGPDAPLQCVAFERVQAPVLLEDARVTDVSEAVMLAYQDACYGVVPRPKPLATGERTGVLLQFHPYSARWAADERWHPDQYLHFWARGELLLRVPDTSRAGLLDALTGQQINVKVVAPAVVKQQFRQLVAAQMKQLRENRQRDLELLQVLRDRQQAAARAAAAAKRATKAKETKQVTKRRPKSG